MIVKCLHIKYIETWSVSVCKHGRTHIILLDKPLTKKVALLMCMINYTDINNN